MQFPINRLYRNSHPNLGVQSKVFHKFIRFILRNGLFYGHFWRTRVWYECLKEKTDRFEGKHGLFGVYESLGCPTWLRDRDSNPNFCFQRAACYHYTIPHRVSPEGFEPSTISLKGCCSATELRALGDPKSHGSEPSDS